MSAAMIVTSLKAKKEAIEMGLKVLVRLDKQQSIQQSKGKLKWDGDLDAMRTDG